MYLRTLFATIPLLLSAGGAEGVDYPRIKSSSPNDLLYRQQQESISDFYRAQRREETLPPPLFYSYEVEPDISLITLSARFALPYSTLASLNRIPGSKIPTDRRQLVIPSQPGLFIPLQPQSDLERLMHSNRISRHSEALQLMIRNSDRADQFLFFAGADFDGQERLTFLGRLFRRPVRGGRISSGYGVRIDPFTRQRRLHAGIDFAAPPGTPVYAARSGIVRTVGATHPVYGRYIIIAHESSFATLYGHLLDLRVRRDQRVIAGQVIGSIGNSGLSTGPHLHFEVHVDGKPVNPVRYLR